MHVNADVDFEVRVEDKVALKAIAPIENYGEASYFQVSGDITRASLTSTFARLMPAT